MVSVLVVDDSVVVRRLIVDALDSHPDIEVVGTAANGRIALSKIDQLRPDRWLAHEAEWAAVAQPDGWRRLSSAARMIRATSALETVRTRSSREVTA